MPDTNQTIQQNAQIQQQAQASGPGSIEQQAQIQQNAQIGGQSGGNQSGGGQNQGQNQSQDQGKQQQNQQQVQNQDGKGQQQQQQQDQKGQHQQQQNEHGKQQQDDDGKQQMEGQHQQQHGHKGQGEQQDGGSDDARVFVVDLNAANNSGVNGFAIITQQGDEITVRMAANGLEANQLHAAHLHGFGDDTDAKSPTIAQDLDQDGFVELDEAADVIGQVLLDLTTADDDSDDEDGGLQVSADGTLVYERTFTFDSSDEADAAVTEALFPLDKTVLEVHGLSVQEDQGEGTEGEVDGTAGYKAELPVASGEVRELSGSAASFAQLLIDRLDDDPDAQDLANIFGAAQAVALFADDDSGAQA